MQKQMLFLEKLHFVTFDNLSAKTNQETTLLFQRSDFMVDGDDSASYLRYKEC